MCLVEKYFTQIPVVQRRVRLADMAWAEHTDQSTGVAVIQDGRKEVKYSIGNLKSRTSKI
jgi:hypothetical protein